MRRLAGTSIALLALLLTAMPIAAVEIPDGDCNEFTNHPGSIPGSYDYAVFFEHDFDTEVHFTEGENIQVDPPPERESWDEVHKCHLPEETTTTSTTEASTTTTLGTTTTTEDDNGKTTTTTTFPSTSTSSVPTTTITTISTTTTTSERVTTTTRQRRTTTTTEASTTTTQIIVTTPPDSFPTTTTEVPPTLPFTGPPNLAPLALALLSSGILLSLIARPRK